MQTLFDGPNITAPDVVRLSTQLERVKRFMLDCEWHSLAEIREACGGSESGISARIRDCRKQRNGGYVIETRRAFDGSGTWLYRMEIPS